MMPVFYLCWGDLPNVFAKPGRCSKSLSGQVPRIAKKTMFTLEQ
jgi:hypothetical protein